MFLLIDNYDSFTYNLVQAFYTLGKNPVTLKNDDPKILELAKSPELEMVCISPGPGHPAKAGLCPRFLELVDPRVPILGVCLGHQLLALHGGAKIGIAPTIMHGKQCEIVHNGKGIFKNLPNPMLVGRYHSLMAVEEDGQNLAFEAIARDPENVVMALQYKDRPWVGLQFHPESVLTPDGLRLLGNFPEAILSGKKQKTEISKILDVLGNGQDLSAEMAASAFAALFDGELSDAQAGAFLMALRVKGESALELSHALKTALARAVRVPGLSGNCIDIVGTGGDGRHSFNCSTATALTMAALGYKVVKHGNRAVSSTSGAADVLEGLGFVLDGNPATALDMLAKKNFTFLFAPYFHPSFKNIGPIRKQLGVRTLFNILGPMINPAQPSHLLMGVARPELVPLVAETLLQSSLYRGAVVCGAGDYDEMTPIGPTNIAMLQDGKISWLHFDPASYGIAPCRPQDLAVSSKEEAIAVLKDILHGRGPQAMMDMVALNTALAILLMKEDINLDGAMRLAQEAVRNGVGAKVLDNA